MTLLSLKYCAGISFAVSYVRNGSGIIAAAPKDEGVEEEEDTQVVDVDGTVSSLQSTFEGGATITLDERDIAKAKVSAFETSIAL